ncbi:MAG: DUF3379 family protein [Dehalococcoidia bacterium]
MNCLEYRRAVGADPRIQTPTLAAHVAGCAACTRYRDEVQRMDQLIYRALNIEIRTQPVPTLSPQRGLPRWAAAAGVVAASLLGLLLWVSAPRESFAEQLVAHIEEEPYALVRGEQVERALLDDVLARSGVRMKRGVGTISFAMNCWFRGRYVPHLVVQDDRGPVTVLVLAEESGVTRREAFQEGEYRGVVVPAPRGAVAVLAQSAQAEQVAERFLQAVEYQL